MEEQQPPAQSPYISSSSSGFPPAGPEHPRPPHEEEEEEDEEDDPEERRPWEEDDFGDSEVLDLTGGAGGFSHPPFTVCFPGAKQPAVAAPAALAPEPKKLVREEEARKSPCEDKVSESPKPSSPEDKDVPHDRRPTAPAITPLAPLAPAAIKEEPAPRRGPSGSADETFFALPTAYASLMHSSAESPDLQELPYKPASPGREDFPSMLHESSAFLPSLSPLSTPPVQVHAVSGSTPAPPPSAEALQEPLSKLYLESTSDLPIVAQTENHSALNLEAQKQMPQALIVDFAENEQDTVPPKMQLFEPLKDALSEKGITAEIGTDHLAFKESGVSTEYVDFKQFSPVLESKLIDQEANSLDDIFKMDGNCMNEADIKPPVTESYDAIDKASVLPESPVDSTHYIAAQTLEMSVAAPDAEVLPLLHDQISENQTDEKKIAEMEAHWSTEQIVPSVGATDTFALEFKLVESGHVATDSRMSAVAATNVSDSLTPDLVQEACESEMHDAAGAQLTYTSKIDLVQTSDSLPEPLISEGQISPSFECTQSVQSPVLPDIVKEAPVNMGVPGLETQPSFSLLEDLAPLVHEQQIKLGSEKPPSYEEAVNDPLTQTKKHSSDSTAFEGFASVESTTLEEIGTPYISIACDLVKETKISNDDLPPGFSEFSKDMLGDLVSQSVPKHPQKDEESSPESEEIDFDRQWGSEVRAVSKVLAVREQEKAGNVHSSTVLDENKLLSDSSPGKVYMESFQPDSDLSKHATDFLLDNLTVSVSTEEEKPLQMEELGKLIRSEKMSGHWEQEVEDDSLCMGEPSPFPVKEDFSTKLAHSETETMDNEQYVEKEENLRNVTEVQFLGGVTPGEVLATTEEHLQSRDYSPDRHEVSAAHLLPKESAPSAREEFVCSVKQEALELEEPKTALSIREEKGERPTPSVAAASLLSARLGKTSVVDLLYWRDIKKTGVVFGASLFLLLSLTVFSIVSVSAYIALALLSVTISYRIYRGVFQAIQKSDEGHPFKAYLDSDVAVSQELVQKYSNVALGHINCTIKELRRLFLVEDLVDSLKFAVLMWVLTYVGALFNGLTLLILALISLFSVPIIYERHQTKIDHYLGLVNKHVKDGLAKIQAKIPGLKPKAE